MSLESTGPQRAASADERNRRELQLQPAAPPMGNRGARRRRLRRTGGTSPPRNRRGRRGNLFQPFDFRRVHKGYAANQWNASGREIDRLGPKYVPLHHPLSPAPVSVVKVATPGGFDWADAAIGAGVSGIALALAAGLALLVTRRSRREPAVQ